ncbi:MAG: choice-of-anchor Q domain-containing protein, partial [Anaerolineales bacterium]
MQQRNARFIFRVVSAFLLSVLLAGMVGISPAFAAGISVTINQSLSGPVQNDPTNKSPIVFQVVFSQAVADFGPGDVDLSGSTGGGVGLSYTIGGSGAVYSVSVTGMTSGTTVVASIPADVVSAGAATNIASTSTDNSVYYETVKPTVTINQAAGQADPTNAAPILYTAVFSEPVVGFDPSDINVTGTAPGIKVINVTEVAPNNGTTYQVSVTGMTGSGTVIAAVKPNAAQDAAGNWSVGSTSTDKTVTYTVTAPTVTINQSPSGPVQRDPANTSPIVFEVIFSAPVTGFGAGDVDLNGSTGGGAGLSYTVGGSGAVYTVSVTGMVSGNTVVATIPAGAATDLAGNANAASTSTDDSVLYDSTPPTVTINQAVGQVDPASAQPVVFTAVFSENVTGFDAADVTVGGSAPGVKTVNVIAVDAKTYTVQISGMTGRGSVSASVKSNAAQDAALNWSTVSTSTDNVVGYQPAQVVDTTVDKDSGACVQGNCSLREAIAYALPGDVITFNLAYPATITLSNYIAINRDLTLSGPGADQLTIQGAGSDRIFAVQLGHTVTISKMTIFAGLHAAQGGGIYNNGTLTLDQVVLSGNTAPTGGAIYNNGTLTITNSTLSGNQATSGAAIYNAGTLSMTNGTVGNNTATGQAGGIYNAAGATATLLHTSIVDNPGGGFYNAGTLNYTSTVIAKNGGGFGDCILAGAGGLGTNLNNFVGNASCSASLSGDPLLAALGSKPNEPTDTFAPFSGSPLLGAANAGTCPATDQRGVSRPVGVGCDIGSFEGNRPSATVNQAVGQADPTASGPILFTVVFGDPVTGFDVSD